MLYKKLLCFLMFTQSMILENKTKSQTVSSIKLVDHNSLLLESNNDVDSFEYINPDADKCKNKGTGSGSPYPWSGGRTVAGFIDVGANTSANDEEMEAPAAKFSILNLLSLNEDKEENGNDYDADEEEQEEEDFDGIDIFDEDETDSNKVKDEKDDGYLKQYHRQRLRMHNLVFPLLLAYKLKFFTVIPLLLGALVLLVGTTGVAGFFFALFAAALGIHVKSHDH